MQSLFLGIFKWIAGGKGEKVKRGKGERVKR